MKEWLQLKTLSKKNLIATAMLVFSCHLGIDIYTPSLPHMVNWFQTSENMLQLAVTTYILGSATAIVFWGPLSDQYGRKPIFLIGSGITMTGAILTLFCQNIEIFLCLRFLQGVGGGTAMCLGRVIAADLLTKKELAVIGATMGLITGMAPMIAPIIGGYMETYIGWKGSFATHAVIVFVAACIFMFVFEESIAKKHQQSDLLSLYKNLLSSQPFVLLTILQGMVISILNCYIAVAPFLVQVEMGKSPVYFGWISGFCAACQLFTKIISPAFIRQYNAYNVQLIGWRLLFFSSLVLLLRVLYPVEKLFIIGIGSAFLSVHFILPYIFSEVFTLKHANSGIISSGLTSIAMLISFILSTSVALIPYEGTGLLGTTYLLLSCAGILVSKKAQHLLVR